MINHGAKIELIEVTKVYGQHTALSSTNLMIPPGEFFSLIGPSGSGKSTLLGTMAGFIAPTTGSIFIDGLNVVSLPPYSRNIGMVFQNYALFPHMSVFENIAFPLRLRKQSPFEIKQAVEKMLETVRLENYSKRLPQQLSGGQQQRVALARAAVYNPKVLLMDEPLGALDKNLREEMQYEIRQFHHSLGATIIYVTHDQDEAATMSTNLAIMKDGQLIQVGKPRELYEHPKNEFVAGFLGEANLFKISEIKKINDEKYRIKTINGIEYESGVEPKNVPLMMCIRPELIDIKPSTSPKNTNKKMSLKGKIEDIVYTAGTIRYRVLDINENIVTVKLPAQRVGETYQINQQVYLEFAEEDAILIPKE